VVRMMVSHHVDLVLDPRGEWFSCFDLYESLVVSSSSLSVNFKEHSHTDNFVSSFLMYSTLHLGTCEASRFD